MIAPVVGLPYSGLCYLKANRGENYYQLRHAISYAGGKLRFKTEHEQDLWAECIRLLANCIIL
jgi:hypothetical protein